MESLFQPNADESYLDSQQLGGRWNCHPKTVQKRAKRLGVPSLLLGGSVLYPLSEILRIERGAVATYSRRVTVKPPQMQGKRWPRKGQPAERAKS
jgi:hypothetical protein